MKKVLLVGILVTMTVFCFAGAMQLGVGTEFGGNHTADVTWGDFTGSDTNSMSSGISVYGEYMHQHESLLYGLGVEFQRLRDVEFAAGDGKVAFVPIYFTGRFQPEIDLPFYTELIGNAGYNFFRADEDYKGDADISGGLYWGAGVGIVYTAVVFQLMYKENRAKLKQQVSGAQFKADIVVNQVYLSAGIRY